MFASAAAQHTGLPLCVELKLPTSHKSNKSFLPITADKGNEAPIPLPPTMISGTIPKCSQAHIFPVLPIPDCTSSAMSKMRCSSHQRRNDCAYSNGKNAHDPP